MTQLILNWVLMTVIAKFRYTSAFIRGAQRILFCGHFLFHVLPNWSCIILCLAQCTSRLYLPAKFGNLVLITSFTWLLYADFHTYFRHDFQMLAFKICHELFPHRALIHI